jgi:hypothetical protein
VAFPQQFWRRPPTREGRNEQKKAFASFLNAIAIAMGIAAFVGPYVNPALEQSLSPLERIGLIVGAAALHMGVRAVLWSLEDK